MSKQIDISEKIYQDFIMMLTPLSIQDFRKSCYSYILKNNIMESRISKEGFLLSMNKAFSSSNQFKQLYELIFNHFKSYTCIVKSNKKNEIFRLSDISSTEEIEIYDISSAFVVFSKTHFKDKMNLLFNITDLDDDGLINEREIKKMIFTVNLLFCQEDANYKASSKLIHQSLAKLQAKKIIKMIIKYPGDLGTIIDQYKFIGFDTFYSAIERINNYKYLIIPFFINFKKCLFEERRDKSYEIKSNLADDFFSVSNELVHYNGLKKKGIETYEDFHNNFKQNKKMIISISAVERLKQRTLYSKKREEKKKPVNRSCEQIERIDYNKLCNIDILPGKINIKQIEAEDKDKHKERDEKLKLPQLKNTSIHSSNLNISMKSNKLRSFQDIMNEINTTLLCNSNEGKDFFEIENISKRIDAVSLTVKKLIKEKEQYNNMKICNPSSSRISIIDR